MKVLLLDNVDKLGKVGDIVEVSSGYARNLLFSHNLAVMATDKHVKSHKEKTEKKRQKTEQELNEIKQVAVSIEGKELSIAKKATEEGKLFGAVSEKDVLDCLKKESKIEDYKIKVDLGAVEKKLGIYAIKLNFGSGVEANCKLKIMNTK